VTAYRIADDGEPPEAYKVELVGQDKMYVSHFLTCPNADQHRRKQ
jgi:hypothetical protein